MKTAARLTLVALLLAGLAAPASAAPAAAPVNQDDSQRHSPEPGCTRATASSIPGVLLRALGEAVA